MKSKAGLILRYIKFLLKSGNAHSVHSPFIFDLYTSTIDTEKEYYVFEEIEELRKKLLKNNQSISIVDLGAGSNINKSKKRKISSIARNSEKSPRFAKLLFRLVEKSKPSTILDLGTSLGITTLYLSKAAPNSTIYTFEGCSETLKLAQKNFDELEANNIISVEGNIDDSLSKIINGIPSTDLVFFDANHRYEPTIRYFKICLQKANEDSIFVFDDIYWSQEMEKAWKEIKEHPDVKLTVDIFHLGLVFFRKRQPKQHFVLRF